MYDCHTLRLTNTPALVCYLHKPESHMQTSASDDGDGDNMMETGCGAPVYH
jgi:hypothetical protein